MVVVVAACGGSASSPTEKTLKSVSLQLNWFPEPEHGEFYGALNGGMYKAAGLDVKINPGGPQVGAIQLVASGKADFGVTDADSIALARAEGIPVVAVAADFQTNPLVLMYHKGSGITRPEDISGRNVYIAPAANYWAYVSKKYSIKPAKIVSYSGSLAPFLADKGSVNQGYVTSEPYILEKQQSTPVDYFLNADLGYNPYVVLFTTETVVKQHPDMVKSFVKASLQGWDYYFQHVQEVNTDIGKHNRDLTQDLMTYSAGAEKPLVYGKSNTLGQLSADRWKTQVDQLVEIGKLKSGSVDSSSCFTTAFLSSK